jgi:hypothetical protein
LKATVGDFAVKFFGLGGSSSIRGYWENYFDEVHCGYTVLTLL